MPTSVPIDIFHEATGNVRNVPEAQLRVLSTRGWRPATPEESAQAADAKAKAREAKRAEDLRAATEAAQTASEPTTSTAPTWGRTSSEED